VALIPFLVSLLPASLAGGRFSFAGIHVTRTEWFYILLPIAAISLARRSWAGPILVLCVVAAGIYLKLETFPAMDELVSPRGLWREIQGEADSICDAGTNREWLYGLEFYHGARLPACDGGRSFEFEIRSSGHARPVVLPLRP
jgi:hypothetical protein